MTSRLPRVFTIPASVPFVPTLIAALRDGTLVEGFSDSGDPLALASVTLYLPTRRACRLARDTFLDITGAEAAILPRIVPIRSSGAAMSGADWLGIRMTAASVLRGIDRLPLFAGFLGLAILLGALAATWYREGR